MIVAKNHFPRRSSLNRFNLRMVVAPVQAPARRCDTHLAKKSSTIAKSSPLRAHTPLVRRVKESSTQVGLSFFITLFLSSKLFVQNAIVVQLFVTKPVWDFFFCVGLVARGVDKVWNTFVLLIAVTVAHVRVIATNCARG